MERLQQIEEAFMLFSKEQAVKTFSIQRFT
jgi:hypothetical protein